ncbi:unnamed protein product [Caenorhabditis brenneri]
MKWNLRNFRNQEKQTAIQDQILEAIGANLEPDCSHPSFPVMIVEKGNGDLASITSIKEFNEIRKEECEKEPQEKRRRLELINYLFDSDSGSDNDDGLDDVVEVEVEDEEEEDDGNDLEEEEAGVARHGRLLEMMMRDVIRDDEAHPGRLRGGAANDLPNVMQRLENMMERQNRQRDAMRNEIVAAFHEPKTKPKTQAYYSLAFLCSGFISKPKIC